MSDTLHAHEARRFDDDDRGALHAALAVLRARWPRWLAATTAASLALSGAIVAILGASFASSSIATMTATTEVVVFVRATASTDDIDGVRRAAAALPQVGAVERLGQEEWRAAVAQTGTNPPATKSPPTVLRVRADSKTSTVRAWQQSTTQALQRLPAVDSVRVDAGWAAAIESVASGWTTARIPLLVGTVVAASAIVGVLAGLAFRFAEGATAQAGAYIALWFGLLSIGLAGSAVALLALALTTEWPVLRRPDALAQATPSLIWLAAAALAVAIGVGMMQRPGDSDRR